jgi:hypothetical protein
MYTVQVSYSRYGTWWTTTDKNDKPILWQHDAFAASFAHDLEYLMGFIARVVRNTP